MSAPSFEFPRSDNPPPLVGDVEFQVVDWFVPENDKSKQRRDRAEGYPKPTTAHSPAHYEIFMFGATADGLSVTAKVNGFQPYFFVKIPQHWTQDDINALKDNLVSERVEMRKANGETYNASIVRYTLRDHLVSMKLETHKDFWGFTNFADFKFMRVTVKSLRLFNDLKRYFSSKPNLYTLYESNIDPFLRFIHERNIQPCGWVRIPEGGYDVVDSDEEDEHDDEGEDDDRPPWARDLKPSVTKCASRTNYCIEVDYEHVIGLAYNKIAPLLIASFDIECTSSHGDFPVAIKNYRKLTVNLMALTRRGHVQITEEYLCDVIPKAFFENSDSSTNPIHRLYPQHAKRWTLASITDKVRHIASDIITTLKQALKGKLSSICDDDSEEDEQPSASVAEGQLTDLLTKNLPALSGDPIIQIGTTVHRYGSDKIIYRHISTYKSCAPIADADVESSKRESECILAWKDMITRLDPDIISGYNIFGFDTRYIADRAKELGIYEELVKGLGRLKHRHCDIEERMLSSSALGDNIMHCFDLDGVVQVDMLKVMQRDHKLDSYKLDAVANKFIVESAKVVSQGDNPVLITENINGLRDGNYIRIEGADKILVRNVEKETGTITLSSRLPDNIPTRISWSLVKDDISPNDIFAKFAGGAHERMEIAKYCLQDCALVNMLLHKLKVLENNIGMGNVCYVPLSYLFMRGQGIKIFSLVARECRLKRHLIPVVRSVRQRADVVDDDVGYEGAIVLPPQEGIYLDDPITVLDYSSLYPSSMISRNISHDAIVLDQKVKEQVQADPACSITFHDITFDEYEGKGDAKRKTGEKTCTFAQFPESKKGIIPSILQMLLQQRKNTRKKIEYETLLLRDGKTVTGLVQSGTNNNDVTVLDVDTGISTSISTRTIVERRDTYNDFEKAVLDARQLAYKITANSLYGQTGSKTSPIFLLEVAACTTATGRDMIMIAKNFVELQYGAQVIYGDTDSIFCKFPNDGKKGRDALPLAIAAGQRASQEIKSLLPKPQCLEYEKTLWPFILFSKKRYVGNLYEDDHTKKPKQKSMGIVLKRRDNAPIVKRIYGGIINILMSCGDLSESIAFLKRTLQDLVDGKVPLEDLIISKTLKGDYKDPTKIAHKVLADRMTERDPGNKPMVNDRIPFVYIVTPPGVEAKLQGDRIEHPEYIREHNLKPDYQFYITNQLLKPISQLFALCVTEIDGYTLVPNYWEQIDIELEGTPRYGDEKKRKTRISNLKMQQVKDILFDPFIDALAGDCRHVKTRKSKTKTAQQAEPKPKMVLKAVEKKRGSQYQVSVTILSLEEQEIWTIDKIYKGRKAETLRMAAIEGIYYVSQSEMLRDSEVCVICDDKPFMKAWKTALQNSELGSAHAMEAVRQALDIEKLNEQRELNAFSGLVYAKDTINYILV